MGGLTGLYELAHQDFERSTIFSRQKLILDALSRSGNPIASIFLWSIHQNCSTPSAREAGRTGVNAMAEAAGLSTPDFLDVHFPATPSHDPSTSTAGTVNLSCFLYRHLILRFLEEMLSMHRRTYSRMKDDLLTKPMARQVIQQLIWGHYTPAGELIATFRIDEEGHPLDGEDRPIVFNPGDLTGVIHPVELSHEVIRKWQEVLEDYQIMQPFAQMHRTVCRPTGEELKQSSITRFMDKASTGEFISLTCQSSLWSPSGNSHSLNSTRHFKDFTYFGIIACISHEASYMLLNQSWDSFRDNASNLREIYFVKNTTPIVTWRNRKYHLAIKDVPALILSEALWLGHQITGAPLP